MSPFVDQHTEQLAAFIRALTAGAPEAAGSCAVTTAVGLLRADCAAVIRAGVVQASVGVDKEAASDELLSRVGAGADPSTDDGCVMACEVEPTGPTVLVVSRAERFDPQERNLLAALAGGLGLATAASPEAPNLAERTLWMGERRLQTILDGAHAAFVAVDAEGLIVNWNHEAQTRLGWSRADALGCRFADLVVDAEACGAYEEEVTALSRQSNGHPISRTFRLALSDRGRRRIPAELTVSRVAAGSSHLVQIFVRDLSDHEQAARDRRRAADRLAYQRLHDELTGLPNRALLLDRLGHALSLSERQESSVAALAVDLDHFRLVNESFSHAVGDEILREVVERLRAIVRASDTLARTGDEGLARLGADEFVVICENVGRERDAVAVAERIVEALAEPFTSAADPIFLTTSVGIAVSRADADAESLIRDATTARQRAKDRGRGHFELFDPAMHARVAGRLREENRLRGALEDDQFTLDYQPLVSAADHRWIGAEALLRWHHPERGLLSPAEFLPLAEETGLIVPIGRWVVERACTQAAAWQAGVCRGRPYRVSVNVSAQQLLEDDAPAMVAEALASSGLDPARLAVEITESVLLDETCAAVEMLDRLNALGARVFLDDFGTGYSSLSYLKRLPLDAVKLDRAFVHGLEESSVDQQIVGAVVQMARALGMTVVAEGVETEGEGRRLRELGCHVLQGFYFARPMPPEEMTALLRAQGQTAAGPPQ
ncbi:MAG TPA: EAL domain-containing protein [Solirubrobacteraceae bacterium]|nr:EAL domain-containing protein [Solirubrobacteraceae bacterium]